MAITNLDPDSATTPDRNHVVGLGFKSNVFRTLTLIFELRNSCFLSRGCQSITQTGPL